MLSIGLDVHQDSTSLTQLNGAGRIDTERVIRGGFGAVAADLAKITQPFRVCFEASCGYGTLYDLLKPLAAEVHVAHPTELKLIFRSKHKNDRQDARKIAKLLYMGEVPEVHVPSQDVRGWRGLIEHRRRLIEKRTSVKNALRAQLRTLGIKGPRRQSLWSKKGLAWLEAQELPTDLDRLRRTSLLAELRMHIEQIKIVEKKLNAIAKSDWRVQLLQTIPGVGPRTAEAVAAYIDVPERFGRVSAIGKYFGVIPCQDSSAGKNRLGHITREGPASVRHLVTEAAWQAIRRSPRMKRFYERVRNGQKQRRAQALVATGHKLLRIMLAMLKNKEEWREEPAPAPPPVPGAAKTEPATKAPRHDAKGSGAALPASASVNRIEAPQPSHRRGRGEGSSAKERRAQGGRAAIGPRKGVPVA